MKQQQHVEGNANVQEGANSNRNNSGLNDAKQENGMGNGSGQSANHAWSRSSVYKPKKRML